MEAISKEREIQVTTAGAKKTGTGFINTTSRIFTAIYLREKHKPTMQLSGWLHDSAQKEAAVTNLGSWLDSCNDHLVLCLLQCCRAGATQASARSKWEISII